MSGIETANEWFLATLRGDAALSTLVTDVFVETLPQGESGLFVVLEYDDTEDTNYNGATALSTVYAVVRVLAAEEDGAQLVSAHRRVTELLNHADPAVVTSGRVHGCVRKRERSRSWDLPEGRWRELAGYYEITTS